MHNHRSYLILLLGVLLFPAIVIAQNQAGLSGHWEVVPDKSTEIPLYGTLSITIEQSGKNVSIVQQWGESRRHIEKMDLKTGGSVNKIPVGDRVWPTNVFMGLSKIPGSYEQMKAYWKDPGNVLEVHEQYDLKSSQGNTRITAQNTYAVSDGGQTLTLTINRSTHHGNPITYELHRAGTRLAYYMDLKDNWDITGSLPENAFLISLQGVVNTSGPKLYFKYPKDWPFTFTSSVKDFYSKSYGFNFKQLATVKQAMDSLHSYVNGYIVWDKSVRTSLIVAFTVAGLEKAVIVSQDMIPLMKSYGLHEVADFRGKFDGMTDAQITKWAYDKYGDRCNKKIIVWMGGVNGNQMQPGIADFGIYEHAFFTNLSTVPKDTAEYRLTNEILSKQEPLSICIGWHDYYKDLERDFVKLMSHYAIRVIGLNTLPNMSFSTQMKTTPGFKFKNHHNIEPGKKYVPEKKVYITCVQTDGLGLGAWLKPGRGKIPYAWEVSMNYYWLAPAMLEYFYTQATPNDFFIGSLSGPGYMYPKAIPKKYLPKVIALADDLMHKLDLNVFEVMDYSEGATVEGNTELPERIVETYYKEMPDAIGFLNGYAPAHTFAVKNGRPFISYDYYLSPSRSQSEAVGDLEELSSINSQRPYFLLMHVRESSDIERVRGILNKLGPNFELVPLDIFLKMAGNQPTFKSNFLSE